ncbi:protein toll-like [Aedes albopictus]|uniref:TIR domain-containing protein n=1 Tax=Aedes albopictus TaxID=7160 RepID=A0ABM1YKM1_AEDAL
MASRPCWGGKRTDYLIGNCVEFWRMNIVERLQQSTMKRLVVLCVALNLIYVFAQQSLDYVLGAELLVNQPSSSASASDKFSCPESNPFIDCSCMYAIADYEIQCPIVNPEITVKIKPEVYAQVQCYDRHDLEALPNLKAGNTTQLKVIHCPLPEDKSILQLVSFLGVENVRDFWYQNYGKSAGVQLRRSHFVGLQGLEKLFLSSGINYIHRDLFADLSNLKWLVLQGNNLTRLENVFDNLTDLVVLELGANQITDLDAGFLQKLPKLRHLNLWHNEIRKVPKEIFRGAQSIEELDLSVNMIESLDPDVFALLPELSTLNLGFNQLRRVPKDLLSNNRLLKEFRMINNHAPLDVLPAELLGNLPNLIIVILSRNGFTKISPTIFFRSTAIQHIDLSYNNLRSLPEQLLRDQHWLQYFSVAYNRLEVLPDQLLENATELAVLDLSFNSLQNLSSKVFASLDKLTVLHLENNALHTIDLLAFAAIGNLETLFLQNNHLNYNTSIDKSPFQYLNNLRVLNLKNNSISTILHDWNYNALQLLQLDLSHNNFTQLAYLNLHFISRDIRIDLTHNQISQVDMSDFRIPAASPLQRKTGKIWVNLNANPLDCNCKALSFIEYIQDNDASIRRIQFATGDLHCLSPDNLQGKHVSEVPAVDLTCRFNQSGCSVECSCFQRPVDLTVIVNCSNQGLRRIPRLPQLDKLGYNSIELHLENNAITELPFEGISAVSKLYARNNSITHLQHIHLPHNLQVLDLSLNRLTTLDLQSIQVLNESLQLERLLLGSNPWQCDCSSAPFLHFIQQTFQLIADINQITCPNGHKLVAISINDLCRERWIMIVAISLTILLLGLLVGIFSSLCYAYHTEIKIWLFKHNLLQCWVTEQDVDKDKRFDAFISYSHHDEDFVANHLVPTLEQPPMNFRTCWHVRDWTPGELITEQMTRSISESRRTIVVLSKGFLESVWARMEFRTAHLNSLAERRSRVIVILYEYFGDLDHLDSDLRAYLRTNTYIRWGDPWFWDRLQYAMPHSQRIRGAKELRGARSYEIGMLEDRLEMSKSQIVAFDAFRGYLNPTLSRSLGRSLEQLDGNGNFEGIDIIESRSFDELFIIITKESDV